MQLRYHEGPGIKLGESLVFHPGLDVEGRYDTNVHYVDTGALSAPMLRVIGHLDLATMSAQRLTDGAGNVHSPKVAFRLRTAVGYREYFHGNTAVTKQRALDADAGLLLKLTPSRVFSFELTDSFLRTTTARNFISEDSVTRDVNVVRAKFGFAPGGGRLVITPSYAFEFDLYETASLSYANRFTHEVSLETKWYLLPKTAIMLEAVQRIIDYYNASPTNTSTTFNNPNSFPLRLYLGLSGLITNRLSVLLKAGYGNGFYKTDPSFSSFIGKAEMTFHFSQMATLTAGFDHTFEDSQFGHFFKDEHPYLRYDHQLLSRFTLFLNTGYYYRNFEGVVVGGTARPYKVHLIQAAAGVDYHFYDWWYIGVGYDLQMRKVAEGNFALVGVFGTNDFAKHQVIGKLGISY